MKNSGIYQSMDGFDIQNSGIAIGQHPVGASRVGGFGQMASASVSSLQAQPGTAPKSVVIPNDWHRNIKR